MSLRYDVSGSADDTTPDPSGMDVLTNFAGFRQFPADAGKSTYPNPIPFLLMLL
jgi:hypothetical protein